MQQILLQERLQIEGNWNFIITFPRTKCRGWITLHWLQWDPETARLQHFVCLPSSSDVAMGHPACRWQCPVLQPGAILPPVALSYVGNILQHEEPRREAECCNRSGSFQSGFWWEKEREIFPIFPNTSRGNPEDLPTGLYSVAEPGCCQWSCSLAQGVWDNPFWRGLSVESCVNYQQATALLNM